MRSSEANPSFQPNILRSPEPNVSNRRPASIDRYGIQSGTEVPFGDPQARYSISYVPGMSEHVVNTGKTLPEAQLKVVLLACEVERLNTLNYNLVKENEILKAQTKKSEREADLETKIAIVLAENEKLNQIVEELHTVYARERESLSNEEYERRIAELLRDLDEWQNKYNRLGSETRDNRSRVEIEQLEQERDALKEQLGRQGRDLEALRARISSIQVGPADTKFLQEQITNLKIENDKLRSELDTVKLQAGPADLLQQRLNQYDSKLRVLLSENEKLNNLIVDQNNQIRALQKARDELQKSREETIVLNRNQEEKVVRAGVNQQNHTQLIERLTGDNKELSTTLSLLKDKLTIMARDNERLNDLIDEMRREHETLRRQAGDTSRITALTGQINNLLEENRKLNDAVSEKMRNFEEARARVLALQAELEQLRSENDRLRAGAGDSTRINQLTIQINSLLDENKKLNDLLIQRTREIETLNLRIRELDASSSNIIAYREKLSLITTENERLNAYNAELRGEIDRLKLNGGGDSTRITQITVQLNGLQDENRRLNGTIDDLRSRLNLLSTDNETLRRQLAESGQGNTRLEHLTVQVSSLLAENERLNKALLAKSAEIDELRRGNSLNESSQGRVSYLTTENERLTVIITERLREIDSLKARLSSLDSSSYQISSLEERIRALNAEKDRLNHTLTERLREIDSLRLRISELGASSETIDSLRARIALLSADNERLTNQYTLVLRESDTLRIRISESQGSSSLIDDLRGKLVLLSAENERLFTAVSETETLRRRIYELETLRASSSSHDIAKLIQERDALKAQLTVAIAERDRFSILLNEKTRELDLARASQLKTLESPVRGQTETITRAAIPNFEQEETIKSLESRVKFLDLEQQRLIALLADRDHEIETLKQRINQLSYLASENERLNAQLLEKTREIDNLRRAAPETGMLDSEKTRIEADYRLLLERQTSELTVRFEGERQSLLQRLQELEGRLEVLTADNDRLSRLANEHSQSVESWRIRYEHLEKSKNEEIDALRSRARESPIKPSVEEGNLSEKVDYLTNEIERLQEHLSSTLKELENWRRKYAELDILRNQELDELRQQFNTLKRSQVEAKEVASKFAAERAVYETTIAQLQLRISDYEKQITIIKEENERFVKLSTSRIEEVEGQKRRQHELKMSQSLELAQLRQQIEVYKANATDVKQLAIKYSADKAADQSQIKQLKQVNENLKAEVDKLYELIDQRKSDFETLNRQNQELLAQHEKLTHQVFEQGRTSGESTERFELISREVETLKSSRDEYKVQAERNSVELTRRSKELVDRIQELDILKMKYEEGLANYQALNTKLFDKLSAQ